MVKRIDPASALLTLGSASPRRAQLLDHLGIAYLVESVDIDEAALVDPEEGDLPAQVGRIAQAKFAAFDHGEPSLLLTADTLVACSGVAMGKPASDAHAVASLKAMSGQELTISSGVCFGERGSEPELRVVSTLVQLMELDDSTISAYVASGAGRDKAGGLALQSAASVFIKHVQGCWSNVVGLPLCQVGQLLAGRVPVGGVMGAPPFACSVARCGSAPR